MKLKSDAVILKKKSSCYYKGAFHPEAAVKPTPARCTNRSVVDYSGDLEIMCLCGGLSQLQPLGPLGGIPKSSAAH